MCLATRGTESQDTPKLALSCISVILCKLQGEEGEDVKFLSVIWTVHSWFVSGCFPLPGDCFIQSLRYKCVSYPYCLSPAEKELPSQVWKVFQSMSEEVYRNSLLWNCWHFGGWKKLQISRAPALQALRKNKSLKKKRNRRRETAYRCI